MISPELLKNPVVLVPICLLVYFIWKKVFIKDSDRKVVSEILVIGALLVFTNWVWSYKTDLKAESFRLHGNF